MNKKCVSCFILAFFLAISLISASSYSVEYTQVGSKLVVKEIVDGKQISNQVSSEILDKSSQGYYFVEKLVFNQSYSEVEVVLNLDTGFILEDDGVFPMEYEIKSDGQIISIIWKLENVKQGYVFPMFVKIKDTSSDYSLLWIVLIIILLGVIGYIFYKNNSKRAIIKKASKRKNQKKEVKRNTKYDYLLDTEKRVIEELKKADRNELWQRQIQNLTQYSKAKVSRLVRNLEARGLVSKIPFGNTNKIRLK